MTHETPELDSQLAPVAPRERPSGPSRGAGTDRLRVRLKQTRDKLIHQTATRLIRLGQENPGLKKAGYWLYGTATHYMPRGREVGKLGQVGDNLYRGAQPSYRAFKTLQELGVDTVINLRPECDRERKFVTQLGMTYIYMPLPPLDAPTISVTIEFLRAVTDPAHGVVFFHCFHGVDRTGTMAACVRIARDNWTVEQALEEMRAYKLHEQGQKAKVAFLDEFHTYWFAQPERFRREVLHLPIEDEIDAVPMPAPTWWSRATAWVVSKVGRFLPAKEAAGAAEAAGADSSR